jgi:hypothetical protein
MAQEETAMGDEIQVRKPTKEDLKAMKAVIERANRGEQKALDQLREFLDRNPQVWQLVGDLARAAEEAWIGLIGAKDALAAESIRRGLAYLKGQLVGDAPSAIEKMLGDQITTTLLEVKHLEMVTAGTNTTLTQATLLLKRLESAQRRHAGALKSLVQVRKLLQEAEAHPRLRIFEAEQKTG